MTKRLYDFNHWPQAPADCNAYNSAIIALNPYFYYPCQEKSGSYAYDPRYPGNTDLALSGTAPIGALPSDMQPAVDGGATCLIAPCDDDYRVIDYISSWIRTVRADADALNFYGFGDEHTLGMTVIPHITESGGVLYSFPWVVALSDPAATQNGSFDVVLVDRNRIGVNVRITSSRIRVRTPVIPALEAAMGPTLAEGGTRPYPVNLVIGIRHVPRSTCWIKVWVNGSFEGEFALPLPDTGVWPSEDDQLGLGGATITRAVKFYDDVTNSGNMPYASSHMWCVLGTVTNGQMLALQAAYDLSYSGICDI
jgi:hypothetical protein